MADAKSPENPKGDSAVTLYWDDKDIAPKQTRRVGFAYGLGSVTGDTGEGQLGLTSGGEVAAGKDFTLTAYVKNPAQGANGRADAAARPGIGARPEKQSVDPVPPDLPAPSAP